VVRLSIDIARIVHSCAYESNSRTICTVAQLAPRSKKELLIALSVGGVVLIIAVALLLLFKHYGLKELIQLVGYPGLTAIVFAESGLFFGFFLPGDSLLVTAGLLATQGYFRIELLLALLAVAAIGGDSVGYWMGREFGARFFKKERKSILFDPKHLDKAHAFYDKHGGKAIILARFVPVIRTFAPIAAGMAHMDYKKFLSFNIVGGLLWAWGMLLLGYFLGNTIPDVDHYLLPIIGVIVFLSLVPPMYEVYKHHQGHIMEKFMGFVKKLPF
jgi:membrane-associated protein